LRRSDCSTPGIARRRRGGGFRYLDPDGETIDDRETIERIEALCIPPAWREVWVCMDPFGHLQATGIDAAGRKQYLYHERWRAHRDRRKFDAMVRFARALPRLRARVRRDLADPDRLSRERVLACAVRMLDLGFFRIGSEDYAERNESYGLATMLREHVSLNDGHLVFDYPAKSGRRRIQAIADTEVLELIAALKRRRGGGRELLAYRRGRRWVDVRSEDINAYLKQAAGSEFSAKDFRTWNATVLAAVALALAELDPGRCSSRERAIAQAVKGVALYLGNTPAVCRASYIDPRIVDRYRAGATIASSLRSCAAGPDLADMRVRRRVESAVLYLLAD
jgi:DNA topoisomerase IB